ncbi:hypothetical protein M1513_00080 [Patescibacteria group bacterium]|nr:hypothetical protein [Patescibacteria group bacterium]MCL5733183.1 hypothetical protein [Patescibacteria group bacterium]
MAIKLKSALKTIPWSLAAKAVITAGSWLLLPFWVFVLVVFYFYFIPLFRPFKFIALFLSFLILAFLLPVNWAAALALAVVFFLILGIKDLIFIERRTVYEISVLLISLLAFISFFSIYSFLDISSLKGVVLILILGYFLLRGLIDYLRTGTDNRAVDLASFVISLIISELLLVLLIMPFDFYSRLALTFLVFILLLDLNIHYFERKLTNRKILIDFTIFFILAAVILASINLGI